jgi:hypothetical protein
MADEDEDAELRVVAGIDEYGRIDVRWSPTISFERLRADLVNSHMFNSPLVDVYHFSTNLPRPKPRRAFAVKATPMKKQSGDGEEIAGTMERLGLTRRSEEKVVNKRLKDEVAKTPVFAGKKLRRVQLANPQRWVGADVKVTSEEPGAWVAEPTSNGKLAALEGLLEHEAETPQKALDNLHTKALRLFSEMAAALGYDIE